MFCEHCGAKNQGGRQTCSTCNHTLLLEPTGIHSAPLSGQLPPNALVKERYRIIRTLGRGGFGSVYKACDILYNNHIIALKEIKINSLKPQEIAEATAAFNREVKVLSELNHPNLPRVYDYFEFAESRYMVMDYIDGDTLESYIQQATLGYTHPRGMPLADAVNISIQLCDVFDHMHHHNPPIIFRDLKPANIMLAPNKCVFLIDFGIARHFKPGQTRDTTAFGSPGYAAPEQYGKSQTTPRSDIYSLGAILHQMLTGKDPTEHPFHFSPIREDQYMLPQELDSLVMQMLNLDPLQRPDSMFYVREKLEIILNRYGHIKTATSSYRSYRANFINQTAPDVKTSIQQNTQTQQAIQKIDKITLSTQSTQSPQTTSTTTAVVSGRIRAIDTSLLQQSVEEASLPTLPTKKGWSRRQLLTGIGITGGTLLIGQLLLKSCASSTPQQKNTVTTPPVAQCVTLTPEVAYTGHTSSVNALAWHPNKSLVASASNDTTVQIWQPARASNPLTIQKYTGHTQAVIAVAWSHNGDMIASSSQDKTVQIWNPNTGQKQITSRSPLLVNALAWSLDDRYLALGCNDGTVHIYEATNFKHVVSYQRHTGSIRTIGWSPDGHYLASAGDDYTVQVWDKNATHVRTYYGHGNTVNAIIWSPDGRYIASASTDRTVQVWVALTGHTTVIYKGHITNGSSSANIHPDLQAPSAVYAVAWQPDGNIIASTGSNGMIHLWNATKGTPLTIQPPISDQLSALRALAWSPDKSTIVAGGEGGTIPIYRVSVTG